ncbi:MAG: hypothetical protein ABSF25_08680 [Bryobacteraceae bacterium]|jgi:hypothetical protein
MKCEGCRGEFPSDEARCPYCGKPNAAVTGVYRTSTVLISQGGDGRVYRSVEEAPESLRAQLRKSLNGVNSATILIADRRGRREIAKALHGLPSAGRRGLAMPGSPFPGAPRWLTRSRKAALAAVLSTLALAVAAAVLSVHWR